MEINPQHSIFWLTKMLNNIDDEGHITYLEPTFYLTPRVSSYSNAS